MQPADLQGRASRNQSRIAMVLALATATFGVSTVYLARSLHSERAQPAAGEALAVTKPAASSLSQDPDLSAAASTSTVQQPDVRSQGDVQGQTASPMNRGGAPLSGPGLDPVREAHARKAIEELSDPVQRAQSIASTREGMAPYFEEIANGMGLQPQEAERVLDFMAETSINNELRSAECQLRPGCNLKAEERLNASSDLDHMARTLGPEGTRRFLDYEARRRVVEFSKDLPPEQALTEDRVARLTEAFVSGRQRWINTQDPVEALDRQLRDDAAAILSEEQLGSFDSGRQRYFNFD